MKILANDGIDSTGKKALEAMGCTVVTEKVAQENLAAAINAEGYDGLLVRSATTARKDLIDACPGLKFIGRGGVGIDNIDADYARSKGVDVFNTPASSSQAVAELVMSVLFVACMTVGAICTPPTEKHLKLSRRNTAKDLSCAARPLAL
jgi:D-3-phosphoglycerate dehydrogenase